MFFHRTDVDSLADSIREQVLGANTSAKMGRRFYRRGKRDGKRRTPFEPTGALLGNAADLAASWVAEEYLGRRERAEVGLHQLVAEADQLNSQLSDELATPRVERSGSVAANGTSVAAEVDLSSSLDALRERRAATTAAAAAAQRAELRRRYAEARERVAAHEREIELMADVYIQRIQTAHAAANLLWSRYCAGFADGKVSRGAPDDTSTGPPTHIDFAMPTSLVPAIDLRNLNLNGTAAVLADDTEKAVAS